MSYGTSLTEFHRQVGVYADRILKGAEASRSAGDAVGEIRAVLNLQTARMLGLDVPSSIIAQADDVIELNSFCGSA